MAQHPDQQLRDRALGGDRGALRQLVARLTPIVQRRAARALLRSGRCTAESIRAEVEDRTQDVMLLLFAEGGETLRAWEPERGLSLDNFVGLIAQRRVLAVLASRRQSPFSAQPAPPEELAAHQDHARVSPGGQGSEDREFLELLALRLRERLSPLGLQLFYRLYVFDEAVAQVCRETGLSAESVYQWRTRIKKLAIEIQDELLAERPAEPLGKRVGT